MARSFEDTPATREKTPLMLGFVGASGSGKTFSALRVATGIQRVCGGDIHVIDTEQRRALHYAPRRGEKADPKNGTFNFRHLAFGAPFSSLDYLAAIEHCVKKGAKTIVIDSMSHEHEGPGGLLEMHEAEVQRMAGNDWKKAERVKMLAYSKPKAMRRKLIQAMIQMDVNFLLCFRAKHKIKPRKGEDPLDLGYMPIAGEEFVFEMVQKFLFYPGSSGIPTLRSDYIGEREMIKIPHAFRGLYNEAQPQQLSEDLGEMFARWAAGDGIDQSVGAADLIRKYQACSDPATFRTLETTRGSIWERASKDDKAALKRASDEAKARMEAAENQRREFEDSAGEFGGADDYDYPATAGSEV